MTNDGCLATDTINVGISNLFIDISTIPSNPSISLDEEVQITTTITSESPLVDFQWQPSTGLSCTDCLSPTASPSQDQTYTFIATNSLGCVASETINITVNTSAEFYIPNAFSPNGDNFNDLFTIYGGGGVAKITTLQIFDRWGNHVYGVENFEAGTEGWDGTLKGQAFQPAVFVYKVVAELKDGTLITKTGGFVLLR